MEENKDPPRHPGFQLKPRDADKDRKLWEKFKTEFELGGFLGCGAEASIYLCRSKKASTVQVCKLVHKARPLDGDINEHQILVRKLAEREFLVACEGAFYDPKSKTGLLFLEYCNALSLGNLMNNFFPSRKEVPEPFVWHVMQEMADALDYIHKNGIVHHDVKPDNVLLSWTHRGSNARDPTIEYPYCKLADFGFSHVLDNDDNPKKNIIWRGTPPYMPPEVPSEAPSVDVWSLGVSIHELMYHTLPFPYGHHLWTEELKALCDPDAKAPRRYIRSNTRYSGVLQLNLRSMLRWNSLKRITARALAQDIRDMHPCRMDFVSFPSGRFANRHLVDQTSVVTESHQIIRLFCHCLPTSKSKPRYCFVFHILDSSKLICVHDIKHSVPCLEAIPLSRPIQAYTHVPLSVSSHLRS